jgi:phosphate:Na+ symporter
MGLGAAGVLDWQTAIAFAIGADLGTTVTSWIASLNLSKNAKRTAYAHIGFNLIGVTVVLILFFPAIAVLKWVMDFFGGDPGVPVVVDGNETFPLVPVAVGVFSIFFNIFNVLILFPFVNRFERILSRIGHTDDEDVEDFSVPRYLDRKAAGTFDLAVPAMQREVVRTEQAGTLFLDIARQKPKAPKDPSEHYQAVDGLAREIRAYAAAQFREDLSRDQLDLLASMIEEVDFTGSLNESLYQIARRVKREDLGEAARTLLDGALMRLDGKLATIVTVGTDSDEPDGRRRDLADIRWDVIDSTSVPAAEKGAVLALLGSFERAEGLVDRIQAERASVDRSIAALVGSAA